MMSILTSLMIPHKAGLEDGSDGNTVQTIAHMDGVAGLFSAKRGVNLMGCALLLI